MRYLLYQALAIVMVLSCSSPKERPIKANAKFHREIPYPKSDLIESLQWTSEPYKYPGTASDMHWWTWGIDDAIYTVEDDGSNFGGRYWYAHLLRVTGIPPNHKVETVTDFENYDFRQNIPKKLLLRYVCGLVAVDSAMYVCLYDYDWNIPSKPAPFDSIYNRMKRFDPWVNIDKSIRTNLNFINKYSKLGGVAAIIKSVDGGKTWTNLPDENIPPLFSPSFGAPAFLTFGKGNTETPQHLAPYVYAVSNDGSWETGNDVRMGRVHRDSVIYREAWQFFGGIDKKGQPNWVKGEAGSRPILTDPGHVGHPTITYNKALNRYILLSFSDAVPQREDAPVEMMKKWDVASELQMYESKNPWGPWKVFYSEMPWGGPNHTNYLPQMPSKWISEDGLSGSIIFSGDYTRDGAHYAFMTQSFKLKLK
jgi:hypothetical protein